MVDFAKMATPEAKDKARQDRAIREQLQDQKDKANKFACNYLMGLVNDDEIENEYDRDFIRSVNSRLNAIVPLTEKQQAYLDELFHHKY